MIEETRPFFIGQLGSFEVKDCAHETKGIQGLEVKEDITFGGRDVSFDKVELNVVKG